MRDATLAVICKACERQISIHASHAGCDFPKVLEGNYDNKISIHASHAGCDVNLRSILQHLQISIHASHAGCDAISSDGGIIFYSISIHASHAGCDLCRLYQHCNNHHFNPRIPCGMRHESKIGTKYDDNISIHASHAGCDGHLQE